MRGARDLLLDLEQLTSSHSDARQPELLDRVTDLFFATSQSQSASDIVAFGSVLERIAYEVEVEARAQLAKRLAPAPNAPAKLVRTLAADEISVARPILEKSACLTDRDLVDIAESHGQDHLHAIASRPKLSSLVTDVIVTRGDDRVLTKVAGNEGARFSFRSLEQLSDRAQSSEPLLSALSTRTDVPDSLIEDIKLNVTARLSEELLASNPDLDSDRVEAMVAAQAEKIDVARFGASNEKLRQLHRAGRIKEPMLVNFARQRRLPETVRCLALLTGLDDTRVSHCLLKGELTALGVLCKASGFDNTTFAALLQIRTTADRLDGRDIADAMRSYHALSRKAAVAALDHVKEHAAAHRQDD